MALPLPSLHRPSLALPICDPLCPPQPATPAPCRAPLESLELAFCALLPEDLRFLASSSHAVHLKKLDLSGNDLSGSQLSPSRVCCRQQPHCCTSS